MREPLGNHLGTTLTKAVPSQFPGGSGPSTGPQLLRGNRQAHPLAPKGARGLTGQVGPIAMNAVYFEVCPGCCKTKGALYTTESLRARGVPIVWNYLCEKCHEQLDVMLGLSQMAETHLELCARLPTNGEPTYETWREDFMPKTSIYVEGEDVSVVTDARDERDFTEGFAPAFGKVVNANGKNPAGTSRAALTAAFDIIAKLRGYKSGVQERRVLAAGRWPHPNEKAAAETATDDPPSIEGAS